MLNEEETQKIAVIILKFEQCCYPTVMYPKDADRIAKV